MLVYVLNNHGKPLMPCKPRKARLLLKEGKAKVKRIEPFTIQLLYGSSGYKQEVTLGVDSGSKTVGLSATTESQELFASNVELRNDIVDKLATRSLYRRARRSRLRYRKARFDNRVSTKKKGWLAPSIKHKIDTHLTVIKEVYKILPITKLIVEVASFDIQKLKNPNIQGEEYQQGEQLNSYNVREYVLFRDGHTCQNCKGKSKDNILQVHHIESRKTGGNTPSNLVTLCRTCHTDFHKGKIELKVKRGKSFKDATFMGIMRWVLYDKLKSLYNNVSLTYGYITKSTRISNNLPKEHFIDARCISGNPKAKPLNYYFKQVKVRRHNRQIHKANFLKGGEKRLNQSPYIVKGFRLFDKVEYNGKYYYIYGRRATGYFNIRDLSGTKVDRTYKKLNLKECRRGFLIERMVNTQVFLHTP